MGGKLGPIGRLGALGGSGRLGALGVRPRSGNGPAVRYNYSAVGADTFVAPEAGLYDFFLYGPGGIGGTSAGSASSSGGGGGAAKKRKRLTKGQTVSLYVGSGAVAASSTDHTTVTFPDLVVTATRGSPGSEGYARGGNGGYGINGDTSRVGGTGLGDTNPDTDLNTQDGVSTGTLAQFGGAYFGGGAGFTDEIPDLAGQGGGQPFTLTPAGTPGGSGYGTNSGNPANPGGDGYIVVKGPY